MRRSSASPSKMRRGSFASSVSSVRAAERIFDSDSCTRQISRLPRRPYSPSSFISASRRSFSKGRRGFLKVLPAVGGKRRRTRRREGRHADEAAAAPRAAPLSRRGLLSMRHHLLRDSLNRLQ